MPRSATDATRFTATGPYASAKPGFNTSSISIGSAPANETPQQKIARLRAAAARAKAGKESQFDKVVRVGRVWADRAHRTTAWSLIGLTVVCGTFATFSIGDMLIHNRRKRNEWLQEQQANSARLLEEARVAAARGTANDDQILLLNRERAAEEAEAQRAAKKGIFARAKEAVVGDGPKEEQRGGRIMSEVRSAQLMPPAGGGSATPSGFLEEVNTAVPETAIRPPERIRTSAVMAVGGPLDKEAEASTAAILGTTRSWWSRLTGR